MGQYQYDDTGAIFNYFLLAILSIALIPTTYSAFSKLLTGSISKEKKSALSPKDCPCAPCSSKKKKLDALKKPKSALPLKWVMLFLGWALFVFVGYQVYITPSVETGLWDPYTILGVDPAAGQAEIKAAFRKLSLRYHPDKVPESEKEEAAAIFIEISKAHTVLTDDEARKTFDEFGHPDGKQAMSLGIALPKWLVDTKNNLLVLFIYGSVFGVALPFYVARWWYSAKSVSGVKIQHATMGRFYKELKDSTPFRGLVDLVSKSNELLTTIPYRKPEAAELEKIGDQVNEEIQKIGDKFDPRKKVTTLEAAISRKIQVLLLAHLLRVPVTNETLRGEQDLIIEKAAHVTQGLLQIAAARFWLTTALNAIDLRQMIVQGTLLQKSPLSQLPHMTPELVKQVSTKKRPIQTIRQLVELSEEDLDEVLKGLTPDQRKETLTIAEQYPILRVRKAHLSVIGEPAITPSAIVTLVVKVELITVQELRRERAEGHKPLDDTPEPEPKKAAWFDKKESVVPPAHAPYFPVDRPQVWWVMLADRSANRLIVLGKVTDLGPPGSPEATVRLQFQAPPRAGEWNFHVFIKSDSVLGCDGIVPVKLVVQEPSPDADDVIEDDISEPDEDTIAGQMQAIRSGKALGGGSGGAPKKKEKVSRADNEDSSDSDDGSEGEYEDESD
ncbi:Sec63 Brl domain-containing protein [Zopfochytrium polystomum]|nr:Sec63 Brl domain-containing protein [Zopfochytrium polystomum]